MSSPPVLAGANHVSVTDRFPNSAFSCCGSVGIVAGFAVFVLDGTLSPFVLIAITLNV